MLNFEMRSEYQTRKTKQRKQDTLSPTQETTTVGNKTRPNQREESVDINREASHLWQVRGTSKVKIMDVVKDFVSIESSENEETTIGNESCVISPS